MITAPTVSRHCGLSTDAERITDLGPGDVIGARVGDGHLGDFRDRSLKCTKVMQAGLGLRDAGISLAPAEVHVVEGGTFGAHRAPVVPLNVV